MGLVSKSKQLQSEELTKKELEFLLAKLRSANYKGDEFEIYFSIIKKIYIRYYIIYFFERTKLQLIENSKLIKVVND